jgi:hypothetical protein
MGWRSTQQTGLLAQSALVVLHTLCAPCGADQYWKVYQAAWQDGDATSLMALTLHPLRVC